MTTSIIIPVFNEEKFLPLLLQSLENQTHKVDEVVICDNKSTDSSVEIAYLFKKRLPIVILTQRQKGIKPTLEKAWRTAKGDIILRVDADTVLPPNWVKCVLAHFITDPDLTAVNGPTLPSDGNVLPKIYFFLGWCVGSYIWQLFKGHPLLIGCNSAFKRKALEIVNGYQTSISVDDDQLITVKLLKAGFKLRWFVDCFAYHSTRRFCNPKEYVYVFLSLFSPRFYNEKQM